MAKKKSLKAVLVILISLVMLAALWITVSLGMYMVYFGGRFESDKAFMNHVESFEGLERTRYEFKSDKGQTIVGYMYSAGIEQKAIIVFAHGYGAGGHNSYMPSINYFAQNGYYVFAYDATGNDESGGKGIGGVPQGVIDLNYAISFVEDNGNFPDLPIGLFGHSWFIDGSIKLAESQTMGGGKCYTYFYRVESSDPIRKSAHFEEVPIVFAHPEFVDGRPYDPTFSKTMRQMWVQFAKTGNPSLSADISPDGKAKEWPLYDLKDKQVMVLDEFDIHPAKESDVKIVDWDRTFFLTKYYML